MKTTLSDTDRRCCELADDAMSFAVLVNAHDDEGHAYTAQCYAKHVADLADKVIAERTRERCALLASHAVLVAQSHGPCAGAYATVRECADEIIALQEAQS